MSYSEKCYNTSKYTIINKEFVYLLCLLFARPVSAQLCTGSLGDPVVDINFGAGTSTHGNALGTGVTSYNYSSASFPIDGSYTIENTTSGAGSVWWSTTDHTGNSGGYMMVVNASYSVTDCFYKRTVTGLCPNTTYEFATWVMNLLKSQDNSPPNITFSIETTTGVVLNSYNTGAIAIQSSALWRQFGFFFTTPANVSDVVIRMRNNSAGGAPANDLALDDITFRPCGPSVSAGFEATHATLCTVCAGVDTTLLLEGTVSSGYNFPAFQWQELVNGQWQDVAGANMAISVLNAGVLSVGTFQFRLTVGEQDNFSSEQCRVVSNIVTLIAVEPPVANYTLSSDVICVNQPIQFVDQTQTVSVLIYQWDFGDGQNSAEQNPWHTYQNTGVYSSGLIVSNNYGCIDTAILAITINVQPVPLADFSVTPIDTTIFYPCVFIENNSDGNVSCSIDWGDETITDCSTTYHCYAKAGTYSIIQTVENQNGCFDRKSIKIVKESEYRFFVPNAFTPDGDGINDKFKPQVMGVHEYSFMIYNKWGQKLFETSDGDQGWDGYCNGSRCKEDVYVYNVHFYDDVKGSYHQYAGTVMLLH